MSTFPHLKEKFLKQAYEVALSSPSKKKVGAILLRKKKVIAASCNYDRKSHPIQSWWANKTAELYGKSFSKKVYIHAEIGALIKAKEDSDTIIVCRLGGQGGRKLMNSRPCKICSAYIMNCSQISHVYYSTENGFAYEYWGNK